MADLTNISYAYLAAMLSIGAMGCTLAWALSKITTEIAKSIARQPEAADKIKNSTSLPMFLIEGACVLGMILCLVFIVLTKG